jgi:hypothetical protein
MQDDAEASAPVRELGEKITEEASPARRDSRQTTATARRMRQQVTTALERALSAKRRELAAHFRAIELHERAVALQDRLGHPDRAANARQHAERARELHERALQEQTAQEAGAAPEGGHRAG